MITTHENVAVIRQATGALKDSKTVPERRVSLIPNDRVVDFRASSVVGALHLRSEAHTVLDGKDYPVLVRIWDNDSDAIFDDL